MPVLVICKFDDDLIKQNEGIIVSTTFSPLYVYGNLFGAQGRVIPKRIVRSGRKSNLSSLPASLTEVPIKNEGAIVSTIFSQLYAYGSFWSPWKSGFSSDLP